MEGKTVCNNQVLRCLKDKIKKSRNVEEIKKLIEKDKIPKTYEPTIEEIQKDQTRRACNRRSALQSRERQKKAYKQNRKSLEELKEYNTDIKGKLKRLKHNKDEYMTVLSAWMTKEEIQATLDTKLKTDSFDFLVSTDKSRDQSSMQDSSGNEYSTEDSDSVTTLLETQNNEGSADGFDALSQRIPCTTDGQQLLATEGLEDADSETEYIQYTVIQESEGNPDEYTYGAPVSFLPMGGDQFVLVAIEDTINVDFLSKYRMTDSETQIIYVTSDGAIYTEEN